MHSLTIPAGGLAEGDMVNFSNGRWSITRLKTGRDTALAVHHTRTADDLTMCVCGVPVDDHDRPPGAAPAGHQYGVMDGRGGQWLVEACDEFPEPSPIGRVDDILRDAAPAPAQVDGEAATGWHRHQTQGVVRDSDCSCSHGIRNVPAPAQDGAEVEALARIIAAVYTAHRDSTPFIRSRRAAEAIVARDSARGVATAARVGERIAVAIEAIHQPYERQGWQQIIRECRHDGKPWPCPTVAITRAAAPAGDERE